MAQTGEASMPSGPIAVNGTQPLVNCVQTGENYILGQNDAIVISLAAITLTLAESPLTGTPLVINAAGGAVLVDGPIQGGPVTVNMGQIAIFSYSPSTHNWSLLQAGSGMSSTNCCFVFRPGGVTAKDVYADWLSLYAAFSASAGTRSIQIDDSIVSPAVIPAGTYDLSGAIISGTPNINTDSGGALLDLANGVVITAPTTLTFDGLDVRFLGASTCITTAANEEVNLYLRNAATLACSGAGAFLDGSLGFGLVILTTGTVGDSVHTVLVGCDIQAYNSSGLAPNSFTGGTIFPDDSTALLSVVPFTTLQSNARLTAYNPAVAGNWAGTPPATVAQALDRIAANVGNAHPIP
jgi:hypothetical protein